MRWHRSTAILRPTRRGRGAVAWQIGSRESDRLARISIGISSKSRLILPLKTISGGQRAARHRVRRDREGSAGECAEGVRQDRGRTQAHLPAHPVNVRAGSCRSSIRGAFPRVRPGRHRPAQQFPAALWCRVLPMRHWPAGATHPRARARGQDHRAGTSGGLGQKHIRWLAALKLRYYWGPMILFVVV